MRYRPEIDGLRAVAVVPVILYHAGFELFSGGFVGVDIFFVISGYLITTIILSEKEAGTFRITNFYERRARRILPALFLVMTACIPFAWMWLSPFHIKDFSQSIFAVSIFSSNILFWLESGYFDPAAELKPLLHTWSLAVEEQFYVLFPLFLLITWKLGKRQIVFILIAIAFLSLASAQWGSYYKPTATFYILPTRGWELLIGAFTAFYLFGSPSVKGNQILSLLGLMLILCSFFVFDKQTPFPSFYTLAPTIGTALIILFTSDNTYAHRLLSNKPVVGLGLISYSAYLWHQPIFVFTRHKNIEEPPQLLMAFLAVISIALAYLSWRFFEKPFRDKARFNKTIIFTLSFSVSVIFLGIGSFGSFNNSYLGHLASDERLVQRINIIGSSRTMRQSLIRAGLCQFTETGAHKDIKDFVLNWACFSDDEDELIDSSFAVYGDSYSADKVVALRLNGFDTLQVGGDNCPLLPVFAPSYCDRTLSLFHKNSNMKDVNTVLLARRFPKKELNSNYLSLVLDYWSNKYNRVVLFSPMPEFPYWVNHFIVNNVVKFHVDFSAHNKFFEIINKLHIPSNVVIVNTAEIFCEKLENCSGAIGKDLLLVDYGHLSPFGAKYFGRKLLSSGMLGKP